MVAVIALAVLAVAAPLLGPVFGRSFAGAVWPLAVLVPAMIPYSVNSTLAAHLSGSGRPLIATKAWAVNVAVNVVANVLLLPRLGVVGAGLASLASYTVCATIMSVSFRRITSLPYADFLVPRVADIGDLWRALHGAVLERGRG
jgi:O-antigen/teichoic acid export membrane protein